MICYTKGGNKNMQSIPPWEAVQKVKQNNSPLCTSECKNSSFSCSLQTNKETVLGAAGKAGGHGNHPGTGKQIAAGYNNIVLLCSVKLCLLKHKPEGL